MRGREEQVERTRSEAVDVRFDESRGQESSLDKAIQLVLQLLQ